MKIKKTLTIYGSSLPGKDESPRRFAFGILIRPIGFFIAFWKWTWQVEVTK